MIAIKSLNLFFFFFVKQKMELLILKAWGRGTSRNMDIQKNKDNLK